MNKLTFLADTMNINKYEPADGVAAGAILSIIFLLICLAFLVAIFVFWMIALIHLIKNEDVKDRVLWIVLLFVVGGIIGPVYYFAIKMPYDREKSLPKKPTK